MNNLFSLLILIVNVNRAEKAKVRYLCGLRVTAAIIRTHATVTDTQTVYIRFRFRASLRLGMLQIDLNRECVFLTFHENPRFNILNDCYPFVFALPAGTNRGIWKNVRRLWPPLTAPERREAIMAWPLSTWIRKWNRKQYAHPNTAVPSINIYIL